MPTSCDIFTNAYLKQKAISIASGIAASKGCLVLIVLHIANNYVKQPTSQMQNIASKLTCNWLVNIKQLDRTKDNTDELNLFPFDT